MYLSYGVEVCELKVSYIKDKDHRTERISGKNLFRGFALRLLLPLVALPVGMFSSIYMARKLGPDAYGLLNLAGSIIGLFFLFWTNLGIHPSTTKYVAELLVKRESAVRDTVARVFLLKIGITVIVAACLFVLSDWLAVQYDTKGLSPILKLGCLYVVVVSFNEFATAILQGFARVQLNAILNFFTRLLVPLLIILAVYVGSGPIGAFLAQTVWFLLIAGVSRGFAWAELRTLTKGDGGHAGDVLRYALPLALISITSVVFEHADKTLLGMFGSLSKVGIYSMAKLPLSILLRIPLALSGVLYPFITTYYAQGDRATLIRINDALWKYFFCFAVPAVCGIIYTAPLIVTMLLTDDYVPTIPLMRIFAFVFFFKSFWHLLHPFFVGSGQAGVMSKYLALSSLLNVALMYILGRPFGAAGISWALVLTWALLAVTLTIRFKINFKLIIVAVSRLIRIGISCVLMVGGMELFKNLVSSVPMLIVWIFVGGCIYLGALVLLKVLDKNDLSLLRRYSWRGNSKD